MLKGIFYNFQRRIYNFTTCPSMYWVFLLCQLPQISYVKRLAFLQRTIGPIIIHLKMKNKGIKTEFYIKRTHEYIRTRIIPMVKIHTFGNVLSANYELISLLLSHDKISVCGVSLFQVCSSYICDQVRKSTNIVLDCLKGKPLLNLVNYFRYSTWIY